MPWTETNLTYDTVDYYVFEYIPWFSEHFYKIYDDSDRDLKYLVFWDLADFFTENYTTNQELAENILQVLYKIYLINDKKLQELVAIWFIEDILAKDKNEMQKLREVLKYPEFQEIFDNLYYFWYRKIL